MIYKGELSMNFTTSNIDWINVLAGVIVATASSIVISTIKGLYLRYASAKDLPYPINGTWYSAEFDQKGMIAGGVSGVEHSGRNTFIKVKISRRLGNKIVVNSIRQIDNLPQKISTKWKVIGKIVNGDTLVGTWRSKVKYTSRYGTCILKFIDHGRAVGFWSGIGESDYPAYGYWIMSKSKSDVELLANTLLERTNFKSYDLAECVKLFFIPITGSQ